MSISIVALHHYGVRIHQSSDAIASAMEFYGRLLGLQVAPNRPGIPGVDGVWFSVGGAARTQVHVMSAEGESPLVSANTRGSLDPAAPHVAFAVTSIETAREWLIRNDCPYTETGAATGFVQLFIEDPAGNLIELHEEGRCGCTAVPL